MTGVITSDVDCGDGVCIEREQPSTAFKAMPHISTYGGTYFAADQIAFEDKLASGSDFDSNDSNFTLSNRFENKAIVHPQFLPEADGFMKIGDIKGEFSAVPRLKSNTGSGNHRFTTGAGGDSFNCDDILLGHGVGLNNHDEVVKKVNGTIGYEMQAGLDLRSDNRFVIEPVNLLQGLDAGGMNDAEAVGLDSSTLVLINKVIGSAGPGGEDI